MKRLRRTSFYGELVSVDPHYETDLPLRRANLPTPRTANRGSGCGRPTEPRSPASASVARPSRRSRLASAAAEALGRAEPRGHRRGDARQIVMAVSPTILVAIDPQAIGTVDRRTVDELNTFQIRGAVDYVFMHPDSDLEPFVHQIRFGFSD